MKEMQTNTSFIDNIINKQPYSDTNTRPISSDENSKRKSNNKRKGNKNK